MDGAEGDAGSTWSMPAGGGGTVAGGGSGGQASAFVHPPASRGLLDRSHVAVEHSRPIIDPVHVFLKPSS